MRVGAGIEMLEIPAEIGGAQTFLYPTLIWDDTTSILIDAGFPGQIIQFQEAIAKSGNSFDRIDRIIITHHDRDHIGSLRNIMTVLPKKPMVLAHEEEKVYIEGRIPPIKATLAHDPHSPYPPEMRAIFAPQRFDYLDYAVQIDIVLKDKQELPFCGGITIIHAPGHTPGHICLYIPRSKTLVAGDAFSVEAGRLSTIPKLASLDWLLSLRSLDRLMGYDIENVICYHGGLWTGEVSQFISELKSLRSS